jgi:hypothetical protein
MRVRLEFEYEGIETQPDEHPGNFYRVVERDFVRLPAVGEGIEFDPGSEAGGGAGTVRWIMWDGDGAPRLHLETRAFGTLMTRKELVARGWTELLGGFD